MGEEAQEAFFRASDEQLDQAAAYPFMTPIFGEGVVFDGTPEQRKQALRNQSLTAKFMKAHAESISSEVRLKRTTPFSAASAIRRVPTSFSRSSVGVNSLPANGPAWVS